MAMTKEDAHALVVQLQQAHRLSVGFYRRILPTLDVLADKLECKFWWWEPAHTSRPGRGSSQPSSNWAWDFVPLYASNHTYIHSSGEMRTGPEDFGIQFTLYVEDSFEPDKRGSKGQPDPVSMPSGKAILEVWLYRPKQEYEKSIEDLWSEETISEFGKGKWEDVSEHFQGIGFEWPLEEVIADIEPIVTTLRQYLPIK